MKIAATPKAGQQAPYAKIEITIARDRMLPSELRFYRAPNQAVKTETRTGYSCQGTCCTAAEQKMVNLGRGGAWTRLVRKTWKVNEDMSDELFTKRALEK